MGKFITVAVTLYLAAASAVAQNAADDPILDWPRVFQVDGGEVVMFQPQMLEWDDYETLSGKSAVAVTRQGADAPEFGAVTLRARTEIDLSPRSVLFTDLDVADAFFPNADAEVQAACTAILTKIAPKYPTMQVSLDRVIASIMRSTQQAEVDLNLNPPPIFRSEKPAILVMFLGPPRFEEIPDASLKFAANTNWDLLLDPADGTHYLLHEDGWLASKNLENGPWTAAGPPSAALAALPDDENWSEVKGAAAGSPSQIPVVFVSSTPAELILTDGPPRFQPIADGPLSHVANSDSDLFRLTDGDATSYFLLLAGRWFSTTSLDGPWQPATTSLPAPFADIPEDGPYAYVRASVPGTPEADAAVLLASVPQKATVNRTETTVEVVYDGDPMFRPIPQTTVHYAVNTPFDVLQVDGAFYCCYEGVWFVAAEPDGPWAVADAVPPAIYDIPATSPKYNVTYVNVYESTPETVTVGYTQGYTGQYVAAGLLMFGLGYALGDDDDDWEDWWDDHWYYAAYRYPSYYFAYGSGARYDYYAGRFVRAGAARVYGPYGGAGRWAVYNPVTGRYGRGGYVYGPAGGAYARQAYNPWTDRYAARAGGSNIYGSWSRGVVSGSEGWVKYGHQSGAAGTVAGARTSEGGAVIVGEGRQGNTGGAVKTRHGDVYVGHDGNVYRRTDDGGWQTNSGDGWTDLDKPAPARSAAASRPASAAAPPRREIPTTLPAPPTQVKRPTATYRAPAVDRQRPVANQLDREYANRQLGNQRAAGFQRSMQSGAGVGGRATGGGPRR